uniref:Carboxypeptidase n=1 Tax=Acrobeloides nanus TaxID=290746 RepID=A0A914DQ04_9BILA
MTALDNAEALELLTTRFPEYKNRDFYILGESYAGVYVPTLTLEVINRILSNSSQIALKLVGMGLGNGQLSHVYQTNAYVDLAFYRGVIGIDYIGYKSDGTAYPIQTGNSEHDNCANEVFKIALTDLFDIGYNPYNMNQDCYATNYGDFSQNSGSQLLINTKSTDPFMGFPCYVSDATTAYLNQKSVMDAIHIPSSLNISWSECSGIVQTNYTVQYWDSKTIFTNILSTNYPLKVLVMNGDLDGVCSFLADEWFVEDFANSSHIGLSANRTSWIYQQAPGLLTNVAGFVKKFKSTTGLFEIDLITVKGAGHLVPQDRPGPALNVLANFLSSERNYSSFVNISLTPKPLFNPPKIYTIKEKIVHRGRIEPISFDDLKPDQVSNLPGVYVPTLSLLLIQTLQNDSSLKINFKGFLIGNGFESFRRFDSMTKHGYNYFHGRIGKEEWESIRACCDPPGEIFCNISKYVNEDGSPKDNSTCALLVTHDWHTEFGYDDFNLYQDCYNYTVPNLLFHFIENFSHLSTQQISNFGLLMNYGSTDSNGGFQCLSYHASELYLNRTDTTLNRTKWLYTINNWTSFVTAGFVKSLNFYGMASLDLLTIKGAGHFADTDRPGPSLQVLYNFLKSSNYSTPVPEPQSSTSSPDTTSTTPSTLASNSPDTTSTAPSTLASTSNPSGSGVNSLFNSYFTLVLTSFYLVYKII